MTLNTSFQPLLAHMASFEKSADSLMGTTGQVIVSFSLVAFKIFSLSLISGNLIMMCLGCSSLGPTSLGLSELPGLLGSLFPLPDCGSFTSLFFQISFQFLGFLFSCQHPYDSDVGCLKLSRRFLSLSSFFELLFLHSDLLECLLLPSAPNNWFDSQFPSLHCWFPVYFNFSFLILLF